jgi:hypothetical protein
MATESAAIAGTSPVIVEATRMSAAVFSYRLEELPLAMRDMEERPDGFLKGWVSYE